MGLGEVVDHDKVSTITYEGVTKEEIKRQGLLVAKESNASGDEGLPCGASSRRSRAKTQSASFPSVPGSTGWRKREVVSLRKSGSNCQGSQRWDIPDPWAAARRRMDHLALLCEKAGALGY